MRGFAPFWKFCVGVIGVVPDIPLVKGKIDLFIRSLFGFDAVAN